MQFNLKLTLKGLLLIVAIAALIAKLFLTQSELARTSSELSRVTSELDKLGAPSRVQVILKNSWLEIPEELILSPTSSERKFTCSNSSSPASGESLAHSFSVCYIGQQDVINQFENDKPDGIGHVIAVRVSYWDPKLKRTTNSETKHVLYDGSEVVAYQQGSVSVTIRPFPD